MGKGSGERFASGATLAGVRRQLVARLMSLFAPLALATIVLTSAAIYLGGPEHRTRLVPGALGTVLLLIVWRNSRAGRARLAGAVFAGFLGLVILSGMTLNGGVLAPVYALGIVLTAYLTWVFGPRTAGLGWVALFLAGGLFVWLDSSGRLTPATPPTPLMAWLMISAYAALCLGVTAVSHLMFRRALAEAEARRTEAEEAGWHIREREAALRESEERFRLAFDLSPDALNITRVEDGGVVAVNQGFTEIIGYTSEEAVGRGSLELGIWADPRDRQRLLDELRERGSVSNFEARFRTKDGRVLVGSMSAKVFTLAGAPHILAVTKDVTERVWAMRELEERERRYRLLADNVTDVIWTMDLDFRFTYFSPSVLRLRGVTPEEACRQHLEDFLTPQSLETARAALAEELALERSGRGDPARLRRIELQEYRKDGTTIWVEAQVSFIRDEQGRAVGLLGVSRDTSLRRRAERALRESEQRYRSLFESAGDAIFIVGDGRFVDCNARTLEMFGCAREEIVGHRPEELSPPRQPDGGASPERARERIRAALGGEPQRFEWLHRKKDGTPFLTEVALSPLQLGEAPHLLAIVRDISERRSLEQQLSQAQKMEAIGTLAGGIAHDFNNILSIMTGYTEVALLRVPPEDPVAENLRQVLGAGERASHLVGQILTFSRKVDDRPVPCELGPLVKETLKFLRSSLPATIEIRERVAQVSPVVADPTQVHQIVMNLCANAFHALESSGGLLEVSLAEVRVEAAEARRTGLAAGSWALLTVADNGAGIPPEVQARVFEPYFTTKKQGKGTGLGLAMVHGIVSKAGGQIRLQSEPGVGTTFRVYLPIAAAAAPASETAPPAESPGGTERVLIVDDEPLIVSMTREVLEHLGYAVTATTDSAEALARFRERPGAFDLVMTDLTMPKLDGEGLVRGLRASRPDIPVVLWTGYRERIPEKRAQELGLAAVLTKPVSRAHLAAAVRQALDHAAAAPAG